MKGPKGQMVYTPTLAKRIGMIAGGTGITPMLVRPSLPLPLLSLTYRYHSKSSEQLSRTLSTKLSFPSSTPTSLQPIFSSKPNSINSPSIILIDSKSITFSILLRRGIGMAESGSLVRK